MVCFGGAQPVIHPGHNFMNEDLTPTDKIVQFLVSSFVKWMTPILTAAVVAGLNWYGDQGGGGVNPQETITVIISLITIGLTIIFTLLVHVLTKNVKIFQTTLQDRGLPVAADGWFGKRTGAAAVKAIDDQTPASDGLLSDNA